MQQFGKDVLLVKFPSHFVLLFCFPFIVSFMVLKFATKLLYIYSPVLCPTCAIDKAVINLGCRWIPKICVYVAG